MKRVALQQPSNAEKKAFDDAMPVDGFPRVFGAGGAESAAGTQEG
jgi:hypothetical protein